MPNHVINRIDFDCSKERLKEILSAICYDEDSGAEVTGIGTIDFNKITPMPESLNIEDGSRTYRGIELYLTSLNPSVSYYGKEKMDVVEFSSLVEKLNKSRAFSKYNSALTPEEINKATEYDTEEKLLNLGKTAVNNLNEYGATTWYNWRTRSDTWNTKWNSYNSFYSEDSNEICFQTAWDAPRPIIEKLSSMYPDVAMKHSWANEDLYQSCGSETYLDGVMIDHDYPDNTDMEHLEAAVSIWGSTLEDYDLVESATRTNYVNVELNDYELVSVCGKKGLFTNERLTESDIPYGLHLYHLRSGRNGEQFCGIENKVTVDHGGSIVTNEPLDLGNSGFLLFDDKNSLSFEGENMTFGQFMNENIDETEVINVEQN